MSTADAALIGLGERFEKRLLEYMDAWLAWAPLMRAARAEAESDLAGFSVAIQRNGCDAAQARMSELEDDMQPLAEEIIAAPATSLGGLRAKALVALWEALPASAFHHGAFEFRDDSMYASGAVAECCQRGHDVLPGQLGGAVLRLCGLVALLVSLELVLNVVLKLSKQTL
jgi:hypothetical protein